MTMVRRQARRARHTDATQIDARKVQGIGVGPWNLGRSTSSAVTLECQVDGRAAKDDHQLARDHADTQQQLVASQQRLRANLVDPPSCRRAIVCDRGNSIAWWCRRVHTTPQQ